MPLDFSARRACTLVAGISGTGKTTFALKYLVNDRALHARFCWDADGQIADRLGLPQAQSAEECEAALEDGWVVFNPDVMFPGRHADGFAWFCAWTYAAAERHGGKKVLLVDEVWRYCSTSTIPRPLAEVIQTGRVRGLSCMFATQRPNRINEAILNEVSEMVAFRLQGPNALRVVSDLGINSDEVAALPPGRYVALNTESGSVARGEMWRGMSDSRTTVPSRRERASLEQAAGAGGRSLGADDDPGDRGSMPQNKTCSPNSVPSSGPSSSPSS